MPKSQPIYKRVAVVYNPDKERAKAEAQRVERWLRAHHITVMIASRVTAAMQRAQFVVAMGGDGTVLRVARAVSAWNIPVLGVNIGRLGFLAATEVGATYRTLSRVLAGQGRVENRTMLAVRAWVGGKTYDPLLALNECVVRSGATGRVLNLKATVRDRPLASYDGDGIIISTPTGSTAYNLAASGPIVYPELDVLLLSPICPFSLSQRPLVMPPFEIISVEVMPPSTSALLCLDGQVNYALGPGDRVEVRRADQQVQLLMDPDRNFYQVLQTKLKWGGA
jgi:NAD+ kinase